MRGGGVGEKSKASKTIHNEANSSIVRDDFGKSSHIGERLLHCRVIVRPPTNDLHKLSDTQSILMYQSVVNIKKIKGLSFSELSFKLKQ